MIKLVDDRRLISKVCRMHYLENKSQKKIAKELNLSAPTVSRLILNGRKLGIVEIRINEERGSEFIDLERELEQRLGLKEVLIVEAEKGREREEIARAGAEILKKEVKDGSVVGVSMGLTLDKIPKFIKREVPSAVFVPLVGALGQIELEMHSNALAERLAQSFNAQSLSFHAPGRVEDERTKRTFLETSSVKQVLDRGREMDIALLGIGYPSDKSTLVRTGYYFPEEIETLRKKKAVGDICLQAYNIGGSTKDYSDFNRVVGLDLAEIKNAARAIGLAGGTEKARAIIGAARGEYINTLVTDKRCGEEILKILENEE